MAMVERVTQLAEGLNWQIVTSVPYLVDLIAFLRALQISDNSYHDRIEPRHLPERIEEIKNLFWERRFQ